MTRENRKKERNAAARRTCRRRRGARRLYVDPSNKIIQKGLAFSLETSIAATKTGDFTFLINERGQPWVKESFGNWFRDVCRAAGCPGSAHGLRKAGATRAAERGGSERQLRAIIGWTT